MHATDLDSEMSCIVCNGSGEDPVPHAQTNETVTCRLCDGTGRFNHYGPNHPGTRYKGNVVIYGAEVQPNGALHVMTIPIETQTANPGFDQLYGTKQSPTEITDPADPDPNDPEVSAPEPDVVPDVLDQVRGQHVGATPGSSGQYRYESGERVIELAPTAFGGSWPSGQDLSIEQVKSWHGGKGDEVTRQVFEQIQQRLNL